MKKRIKIFVAYFPVTLVAIQVCMNMLFFIDKATYIKLGFYLGTLFGTNVYFSIFLVALTWLFSFCAVSRYAAWGELAFAVNYLVVQQDNTYNILFQVIVGALVLGLTFRHYIEKFPLCRLSLLISFIKSVAKKKSCEKGLEHWDSKIDGILLKKHYENDRP